VNALDLFTIAAILVLTGLGFYHGLIRGVSSLVAIIGGLVLAKRFAASVTHFLSILQVADVRGVLGFIVVFFFFFIIIKVVLRFIQKVLNASILSVFDNILGGALGFIKGLIISLMVIAIIQVVMPKDSAILAQSRIVPYSTKAVGLIRGFIPQHMQPYIQITTQKVIKKAAP
jgi:membrane protein required for colicin V production